MRRATTQKQRNTGPGEEGGIGGPERELIGWLIGRGKAEVELVG